MIVPCYPKLAIHDGGAPLHEDILAEAMRALSSMSAAMSSSEKGMDESSSSRKLWLAAVLLSTISCFMRASTSWLTVSVLYLQQCSVLVSQFQNVVLYDSIAGHNGLHETGPSMMQQQRRINCHQRSRALARASR